MGLPAAMAFVLQGALLFPMLGGALFAEYRLRIIRTAPGGAATAPGIAVEEAS
jgi:hypothetical protein